MICACEATRKLLVHPVRAFVLWGMQTLRGLRQAEDAGHKIKRLMEADGKPFRLYFYMSPYRRSSQVHLCLTCTLHAVQNPVL